MSAVMERVIPIAAVNDFEECGECAWNGHPAAPCDQCDDADCFVPED